MPRKTGWMLLVIANVLCYCVLSFYQTGAAQSGSRPTLANPVSHPRLLVSTPSARLGWRCWAPWQEQRYWVMLSLLKNYE